MLRRSVVERLQAICAAYPNKEPASTGLRASRSMDFTRGRRERTLLHNAEEFPGVLQWHVRRACAYVDCAAAAAPAAQQAGMRPRSRRRRGRYRCWLTFLPQQRDAAAHKLDVLHVSGPLRAATAAAVGLSCRLLRARKATKPPPANRSTQTRPFHELRTSEQRKGMRRARLPDNYRPARSASSAVARSEPQSTRKSR